MYDLVETTNSVVKLYLADKRTRDRLLKQKLNGMKHPCMGGYHLQCTYTVSRIGAYVGQ